jgi:hypothetical protein
MRSKGEDTEIAGFHRASIAETAGSLYESHKEARNLCGASNHVNEKEGDFSCNYGDFSVINFP